jgi:hypothetical protein
VSDPGRSRDAADEHGRDAIVQTLFSAQSQRTSTGTQSKSE